MQNVLTRAVLMLCGAVHAWAGSLALDDGGFFFKHPLPALADGGGFQNFFGQADEGFVVAMLAGPEVAVEFGQFGVAGDGAGEQMEALAGAGFNEAGDEEAVDEFFLAAAGADQCAEVVGVVVAMIFGELAATAGEESRDNGEVIDFITGDGRHGGDPVFRRVGLGPAVKEFESVGGGFFFRDGRDH